MYYNNSSKRICQIKMREYLLYFVEVISFIILLFCIYDLISFILDYYNLWKLGIRINLTKILIIKILFIILVIGWIFFISGDIIRILEYG